MNYRIYIAKFRLATSLMLTLAIFAACTKLCRSGYEGAHCNELSRPKFTGIWSAVDTPGNLIYTDTISDGPGFASLIISKNFAANFFSHAIYASASGATISIAAQQPDSNQYVLQGNGTISGNDSMITWQYQITNTDSPSLTVYYGGTWLK